MDESRKKAIEDGAKISSGSRVNYNYVDTDKLEKLGIARYDTKKKEAGGNNFIRIVSPSSKGAFAMQISKHQNVGADGNTFLCLDRMFGKPCPVCEYIKELKAKNPGSPEIKDLAASTRFLMYVVDTSSEATMEEGTKWFDCPITIYKNVCNLSKNRRTGEPVDPTDPVDGRDVEFTRQDGKRTDYIGFVLTSTDTIPESWYTGLPAFDDILLVPTYDEVKAALSGVKATAEDEGKVETKTTTEDSGTRTRSRVRGSSGAEAEQKSSVEAKLNEVKDRRRRAREESDGV